MSSRNRGVTIKPQNREWLNTPDLHVQYTYEIGAAELILIEKYGLFFDDDYFYWQPRKKKDIIKRAPLYLYPQKGQGGRYVEKWQRHANDKQQTLDQA
jgi:hypothetical protein